MTEDKKEIDLEEREKKMNEENKSHDKVSEIEKIEVTEEIETGAGKIKGDNLKEVKPKKIPTGGILMPGFFTRSKSKERCKEGDSDTQEEATELVETEKKDESLLSQARIKLPNPFRKSKLVNEEDVESGTPKPKKKKRFHLPYVSIFPRRNKASNNEDNLENQTKAGLASMETLDDTDKSTEKVDDMKNIPLNDKDDPDKQVQDEPTWQQKLKAYRVAISALLGFILLTIIILCIVISGQKPSYASLIKDGKYITTMTSCGLVEGMLDDGAFAFRGIPYARPPVGDLRFRSAKPLDDINYCWNGTLLAYNSTDTCIQIEDSETITGSEDCLTLDVVTPYVRYENPLPVVVLIGAESFIGGSPGKMRPSARYARSRDVVFVRPNFRMGVLGFLALEILSKDDKPYTSGNYALSDILQALRWVQLNIAHFGGDPTAVILFGHRAGATLVTALTTMNGANKYFNRAWATSGGALFPADTLYDSSNENKKYLSAINCKDVECLRAASPESLMKAIPDTWRKMSPDLPRAEDNHYQWLVLDGRILQEHPATVWTNEEKGLPVKLVLGTTAHAASIDKLAAKYSNWTEDLIAHHVRNSLLSKLNLTEEALTMYPKTLIGLNHMISDIRTVCPLLAIATQMHNSTFYVVTQTRGEQNISDVDSDVDAIMGRYEPKTPEQRRYFSAIQQLFYHFIWQGKVQDESPATKVLLVGQDVLPAQNYSRCDFWINKSVVPTYAQLD